MGKILSRASAKKLFIENEGYAKSLHEYNCTWLEYRVLHTTKYDSKGNAISSVSTAEPERKHIIPESISKGLYDLVCKKTGYQKEQQNTEKKYIEKATKEAQAPVPRKKVVSPRETEKGKKETKGKSPRLRKPLKAVFTVQVGAFRDASYAKSFKMRLNKKGYDAYMITLKSKKEGKLHKVWVGKFSDREKAESLSEKIKKAEGLQAFVTLW